MTLADEGVMLRTEHVGRWQVDIMPLLYDAARVGIRDVGERIYREVWDYPSIDAAVAAVARWDPNTDAEPTGWVRHPGSGRRRPDGDVGREYVRA